MILPTRFSILPTLLIAALGFSPSWASSGAALQRKLQDAACPLQQHFETVFYQLRVILIAEKTYNCTEDELVEVQTFLNAQLDDVDLSDDLGIIDMHASLCPLQPSVATNTRALSEVNSRELNQWAEIFAILFQYISEGGGQCKFCSRDNDDDRRLVVNEPPPQSRLRGSRTGEHRERVLMTACDACKTIDFSVDGYGNAITGTPFVSDQWKTSHGVQIIAQGGYSPKGEARIYNSAESSTSNNLGSPNTECPGGGIGVGDGGKPSSDGANCESQGNLLVIQQSNTVNADDNDKGGIITFDFEEPVTFGSIGLMDIGPDEAYVEVLTADKVFRHETRGLGDNAVETVYIDREDVVQVNLYFTSSGAVRFISFCNQCPEITSYSHISLHPFFLELVPVVEAETAFLLTKALSEEFVKVDHPSVTCLRDSHVTASVGITITSESQSHSCDLEVPP